MKDSYKNCKELGIAVVALLEVAQESSNSAVNGALLKSAKEVLERQSLMLSELRKAPNIS